MTIQELYDWAKERNLENATINDFNNVVIDDEESENVIELSWELIGNFE